jgi:hypothetical protein
MIQIRKPSNDESPIKKRLLDSYENAVRYKLFNNTEYHYVSPNSRKRKRTRHHEELMVSPEQTPEPFSFFENPLFVTHCKDTEITSIFTSVYEQAINDLNN